MNKYKKYLLVLAFLTLFPMFVEAQTRIDLLIARLRIAVGALIPIVTGIALLAFFWGLVQYIFYAGDENKKKSARSVMVGGIVALFVMFSIWGIVFFLQESLVIDGTHNPQALPPPTVNFKVGP